MGDEVEANQTLVVLEAMKMENALASGAPGQGEDNARRTGRAGRTGPTPGRVGAARFPSLATAQPTRVSSSASRLG